MASVGRVLPDPLLVSSCVQAPLRRLRLTTVSQSRQWQFTAWQAPQQRLCASARRGEDTPELAESTQQVRDPHGD